MKLLQITATQSVNLESATIVNPNDEGKIRFYVPAVDIALDDEATPLKDIDFDTAMMNEFDMVIWVQPEHPAFDAISGWLTANSF